MNRPIPSTGIDPQSLPLRDIHLPDTVAWWPPAIGWWLLLALFIIISVLFIWIRARRRRRLHAPGFLATQSLQTIKQRYQLDGDQQQLVRDISVLLRRTTISLNPRIESASLTGTRWLTYLDQKMNGKPFSDGPGKILVTHPYQKTIDIDTEALLALVENWCLAIDGKKPGRQHDSF